MKAKIMPSEVDKQDLDTLLWIILNMDNQDQELQHEDAAIFGLM
jgi:hypothetical protein